MQTSVLRYISEFRKNDGIHIRDIEFLSVPSTDELREIFAWPDSDPMFDEYLISCEVALVLNPFLEENLDTETNDYFLCCCRSS